MITEDDFQRVLDENPGDHNTRLVFADWLEERDDVRAPGYRAMGQLRLFPASRPIYDTKDGKYTHEYLWSWHELVTGRPFAAGLKSIWFSKINATADQAKWKGRWSTRREAEDAAALAFSRIPLDQRHRAYA